jgi:hypothetical protein
MDPSKTRHSLLRLLPSGRSLSRFGRNPGLIVKALAGTDPDKFLFQGSFPILYAPSTRRTWNRAFTSIRFHFFGPGERIDDQRALAVVQGSEHDGINQDGVPVFTHFHDLQTEQRR